MYKRQLEDNYGLKVTEQDGELALQVDFRKNKDAARLHEMLWAWREQAAKDVYKRQQEKSCAVSHCALQTKPPVLQYNLQKNFLRQAYLLSLIHISNKTAPAAVLHGSMFSKSCALAHKRVPVSYTHLNSNRTAGMRDGASRP